MTSPTTHCATRRVIDEGIARAKGIAGSVIALRQRSGSRAGDGMARRRDEGVEESLLLRVGVGGVLGVPLHSDRPLVGKLDPLDDLVRPRRDDEPGAEA